tara:strand:+ start:767 stop:1300 length:534 start_codon:yes stop_codon:yes gene_type:complete
MNSIRLYPPLRFNCKVSSNKEELERLHVQYNWIPGLNNIRPSKEIIYKKYVDIIFIPLLYKSMKDYIYINHFKFKPTLEKDANSAKVSLKCLPKDVDIKKIFVENEYPYDLPPGTNHYVLWYSHPDLTRNDWKINKDIYDSLFKLLKNKNFEFVWYENPKMSIPEIFHVQVFWHVAF